MYNVTFTCKASGASGNFEFNKGGDANATAANLLAEAADSVARLAANATHEAAGVMSTEASAGSGEDALSQCGMRGASRSGERGEAPSGAVVLTFIGGVIASQLLLYVRCGCMIKAYAHAPPHNPDAGKLGSSVTGDPTTRSPWLACGLFPQG